MKNSEDDIEHMSVVSVANDDGTDQQASSLTALTSTHAGFEEVPPFSVKNDVTTVSQGNTSVARVVACTAITFLLVCFIMVGFSLLMSKDIDQQVRNSNEMLRKHNDRMAGVSETDISTNTTVQL